MPVFRGALFVIFVIVLEDNQEERHYFGGAMTKAYPLGRIQNLSRRHKGPYTCLDILIAALVGCEFTGRPFGGHHLLGDSCGCVSKWDTPPNERLPGSFLLKQFKKSALKKTTHTHAVHQLLLTSRGSWPKPVTKRLPLKWSKLPTKIKPETELGK